MGTRLALWVAVLALGARASEETLATFDACLSLAKEHFYRSDKIDWGSLKTRYRPLADAARPGGELHAVLRRMLRELKASHATVMAAEVFGALSDDLKNRRHATYGLLVQSIGRKLFVRSLLDGGPAAKAGLRLGDRIVSVKGARLIDAGYDAGTPHFFLTRDSPATLVVQPRPDPASRRTVTLREPARMNGHDATRNSVRVVTHNKKRIGVVHIWHCGYQMSVVVMGALSRELKDCDGLVVDLRGRGGYWAETDRILDAIKALWGKKRLPVFLIDERTRSAKEILAHRVRKESLGTLVGRTTEGAVLSAGFYRLPDKSFLELPVADVEVDGVRLEGIGIEPHIEVHFELPYAGGRDPILARGLAVAAK